MVEVGLQGGVFFLQSAFIVQVCRYIQQVVFEGAGRLQGGVEHPLCVAHQGLYPICTSFVRGGIQVGGQVELVLFGRLVVEHEGGLLRQRPRGPVHIGRPAGVYIPLRVKEICIAVGILEVFARADAVVGKNPEFFPFVILAGPKTVLGEDGLFVLCPDTALVAGDDILAGADIEDGAALGIIPCRRDGDHLYRRHHVSRQPLQQV